MLHRLAATTNPIITPFFSRASPSRSFYCIMSAAPKIQALVAAAASAIPKPSKDEAAVQAWVEKAKEEKLEDVQVRFFALGVLSLV